MRVDFLSPLRVERLNEQDWLIVGPFRVRVIEGDVHEVTVPNGFITDFASVPRLPMAYLLAGGVAERAAVLHDYLYQTGAVSRAQADKIFRAALRSDRIGGVRRWLMWSAVRVFGGRRYGKAV